MTSNNQNDQLPQTKTCRKCNTEKPLSEFYKSERQKYGVRSICITCHKQYSKDYVANHKEAHRKRMNEYYHKKNPGKCIYPKPQFFKISRPDSKKYKCSALERYFLYLEDLEDLEENPENPENTYDESTQAATRQVNI